LFARAAAMMVLMMAGPASADWTPEQQELVALSDAWIEAEVARDQQALERILDERFLATLASTGETIDRAEFIARIMRSRLEPFSVVNEVVDIHGDAAVVIATTTEGTTKFTWIAVRKDGRWRVISETFSRVVPEP